MNCFEVKNKSNESEKGEIYIYGDITNEKLTEDDVTPLWFKAEIDKLKNYKYINMYINSGGGGVFAGLAIYNILERHAARKTAYIDGIAASISSVIAMAADEIIVIENSMMMIHLPISIAVGNAEDMRKEANVLDKITETIVSAYVKKTKLDEKIIKKMMAEETWMTGREAYNNGFADKLDKEKYVQASIENKSIVVNGIKVDISKYKSFPVEYNKLQKTQIDNKFESEKTLKNKEIIRKIRIENSL